jgi:hypothetical protein
MPALASLSVLKMKTVCFSETLAFTDITKTKKNIVIKKLPASYGTPSLIIVATRAFHFSP